MSQILFDEIVTFFKKPSFLTVLEVSRGVTTAHPHGTVCAAAAWFRDSWSVEFVAFSERRNLKKKKKNLIYNLSNNVLNTKLLRTFKK